MQTRLLQPMERVTFIVDERLQGEVNSIVSRQSGYVKKDKIIRVQNVLQLS